VVAGCAGSAVVCRGTASGMLSADDRMQVKQRSFGSKSSLSSMHGSSWTLDNSQSTEPETESNLVTVNRRVQSWFESRGMERTARQQAAT
jgi:hypothetical protein